MTQPPSQPPQPSGGSGAPQDPQPGLSKEPAPSSQPPPPPAQPPQAPPVPPAAPGTPPQGAPAAPGTPPAQPGYGYPQGAPVADNPYAQPGPYGQTPPGQAGYGYPQQPQFPGAPAPGGPGGSGGNFFKGKPAAIIGAALAAVLVVGGGVWFATSGGDDEQGKKKPVAGKTDDPKPSASSTEEPEGRDGGEDDLNAGRKAGEAKVWMAKNDQDTPRNGAELMDIWTVGGHVIQAGYKEVTAFDQETGKKAWAVKLPGEVCDTPPNPSTDGKVVVAYKSGSTERSKCNQLQLIDLKTGEKGWQKETKSGGLFDSTVTLDLEMAGESVMVARSQSGSAYSLSDGEELYKHEKEGSCFPNSYAADGNTLVGVASCAATTDKNEQLRGIDAKTGKIKWRYMTPKNYEVKKVYSVSPLVVSLVNREKKSWNIVAFTDSGKIRSQIDGGKDSFSQRCGMSILEKELQSCLGIVASDDTFYMATEEKESGDFDRSNEVIAFDLDTGKPAWRGKTDDPRTLLPLSATSSGLIAYVEPTYDQPGQIVRFGPDGGKPKQLLQHPETTASTENSMSGSGEIAYADGRFYTSPSRISGRDDDAEAGRMLSFGK